MEGSHHENKVGQKKIVLNDISESPARRAENGMGSMQQRIARHREMSARND